LHEALDFIPRDENVSEKLPKEPPCDVAQLRGNGQDRAAHADDSSKLLDELAIAVGLGAGGIYCSVRALDSLRDSEGGEVVNVDGLQPIVTRAKDSKDGKVTENPGNIVDEDILASEEHGRT
jgi:hypothetical protein